MEFKKIVGRESQQESAWVNAAFQTGSDQHFWNAISQALFDQSNFWIVKEPETI